MNEIDNDKFVKIMLKDEKKPYMAYYIVSGMLVSPKSKGSHLAVALKLENVYFECLTLVGITKVGIRKVGIIKV